MSESVKGLDNLSPLQRALIGLKEMRARLNALQRAESEPIAIIGMGCRFPGDADTPQKFWENLRQGFDAITEVPPERWEIDDFYDPNPAEPGKMNTRWGGFLKNIEQFDAAFFGISPREAATIDPQHRLLLEVCWNALENAGQVPPALLNSLTGVFIGLSNSDYLSLMRGGLNVEDVDAYAGTGNAVSIAAGRLSYFLGLQGPNMVIDTACSSSLVTVHLACQSLRSRECNMAIAGGVNLILSPYSTVYFSQLRALSGSGRCKTFDRDADGYVRGEGCGLVILKRLSDATAAGDRILALIRGSATNHDGKSSGLTVPNGLSQQTVIRKALANAGVIPREVGYVETHGSGTPLGDPIEINSLAAVMGENRPRNEYLRIGSVKTNIGHLESAAGIAGLMKVILCLQHREIPPHLNVTNPNPDIPWTNLPLVVNSDPYPWPPSDKKRIAGVSSFGFSGTNAHLIIEEAPAEETTTMPLPADIDFLLCLSAHSEEALASLVANYGNLFRQHTDVSLAHLHNICYSAAVLRNHHNYRIALSGSSLLNLKEALEAAESGVALAGYTKGKKNANGVPKIVFVFPGQGTEWLGMGRELLKNEVVFLNAIRACEQELSRYVDWSLQDLLTGDSKQLLKEVDVLQPVLFAIQVGLARLWHSWGVKPDAVVGYSMGEIAAAHIAGALDLENATLLICSRSKVLKNLKGLGAMAVVELSMEKAQEALSGFEEKVCIAASSSPTLTVLSGEPDSLNALLEKLTSAGVYSLLREENIAAHSAQLNGVCTTLARNLQQLRFQQPHTPVYLTATATNSGQQPLDSTYWIQNLRMPVLFSQAIQQLLSDGYNTFLEISPNPGLQSSVEEIIHFHGKKGLVLPSMKKKEGERARMHHSLAKLYCAGLAVDWGGFYTTRGRLVELPSFPFQRERCWLNLQRNPFQVNPRPGACENPIPNGAYFYNVKWQPAADVNGLKTDLHPTSEGQWLIFGSRNPFVESLISQLKKEGELLSVVYPGNDFSLSNNEGRISYSVSPGQRQHFRQLLSTLTQPGQTPLKGVIHLWSLDLPSYSETSAKTLEKSRLEGVGSLTLMLQELDPIPLPGPLKIWLVTQGGQSIHKQDILSPAQAPMWGFGRALIAEHPNIATRLVDLDPFNTPEENAIQLVTAIRKAGSEQQLALRKKSYWVPRISHSPAMTKPSGPFVIDNNASYLITGGLGGLGLIVARRLAELGARHLILINRTAVPSRSDWPRLKKGEPGFHQVKAIGELEKIGTSVMLASFDIANESQLQAFLKDFECSGAPAIKGVIHAAGIPGGSIILNLSEEQLKEVWQPKVVGAWLLHRHFASQPLDFFVLFSAIPSILGPLGQGASAYASANAFLDLLAQCTPFSSKHTMSIVWGPWSEVGMAARGQEGLKKLAQFGVGCITPDVGVSIFEYLLQGNESNPVIANMDWSLFLNNFYDLKDAPFYREIGKNIIERPVITDHEKEAVGLPVTAIQKSLASKAGRKERYTAIEAYFREGLAKVLRLPVDRIDVHQPIIEMGMDSLMALEMKTQTQINLGISIPLLAFLKNPTLAEMAELALDRFDNEMMRERVEGKSEKGPESNAIFELSYAQQAMWFLYRLAPENTAYNIMLVFRLQTGLDIQALQLAFQKLNQRHENLRTVIRTQEEKPVLLVLDYQPVAFYLKYVQGVNEAELDEEISADADIPFDLENGPMYRVHLFMKSETDCLILLTFHHISIDLWSLDILIDELKKCYAAELKGKEATLAPIEFQYQHFVKWQREMLSGQVGDQHWLYWQHKLEGELPVINLPLMRTRPPAQTFTGEILNYPVSDSLFAPLKSLAQSEGVTMFILFLAAYKTLLFRYTGQEEIVLGTPMLGRNNADFERTAGCFINPVVLRTVMPAAATFATVLSLVRDTVLEAIEHQDFPFPLLVEKLQPARHPSYSPIFQIAFFWDKVLQFKTNDHVTDPGYPGSAKLNLEPVKMKQRGAPLDLTLTVLEEDKSLSLSWQYNTDLFDAAMIHRMARHFQVLLKSIIAEPELPVSRLKFMDADEEQVLHLVNDTRAEYPRSLCIHQIVERQAMETPDRIAIEFEGKEMTYGELNDQSNRLAWQLIGMGVNKGTFVGLYVPRSIEVIVSILGIFKSGGTYVPIDAPTPAGRIEFILEDTRMPIVITQDSLKNHFTNDCTDLLFIDSDWPMITRQKNENPVRPSASSDLAYVMFTSGSTGKPKGVQIQHRSVVNVLFSIMQHTDFCTNDRLFSVTNLSFDISVLEIFLPLICGGRVILSSRQVATNGTLLAASLENSKATFMQATPATWQMLMEAGWQGNSELKVMCGGEALSPALAQKLKDKCHTLWNVYGPTETCIWSTIHKVGFVGDVVPLGRPVANTQIFVLDKNLQPLPAGMPGELYIAGDGLATAYLGNPSLTAEKFVMNPFSENRDDRMYKTGDSAMFLPGGALIFLGRQDEQVKINGYRIEPGEIESILNMHPAVLENVVLAVNDKSQNRRLIAYVVARKGTTSMEPGGIELKNHLRKTLPDYMVPAAFVFLDALPLTENKKVDRKALRQMESGVGAYRTGIIPPRTATEEKLAGIWKEVLEIDTVGIYDNFFDLGGASIQSLRVAEKGKKSGLPFAPEFLFEFQTIATLAAKLDEEAALLTHDIQQQCFDEIASDVPEVRKLTNGNFRQEPVSLPGVKVKQGTCVIESLGVYLPENIVSTQEVMNGCKSPMAFPLERMTGIKTRRFAGSQEFSIDLAKKAVEACLSQSKYQPEDIQLLICCNISRFDALRQFSFEPGTSAKLRKHFGFANALAFDISNACTGVFTAITVADAYIKAGAVQRAMIISGEYISHLTHSAQKEIEGFMDPRLACLTLGDAGIALILEESTHAGIGFQEIDLFTLGKYSSLCIARITDRDEGEAIMLTDPIKQTEISIRQAVMHSQETLRKGNWEPESFQHIIMHQTSETAINDAVRAINKLYDREICTASNTVLNLGERGNTATTTHFVALHDFIMSNRIKSGEKIVFAITGSGQTIGTALYTLDDLPDRMRNGVTSQMKKLDGKQNNDWAVRPPKKKGRIKIESVGLIPEGRPVDRNMVELAKSAAEDCLSHSFIHREDVNLLIYTGVYRNEFLSEPAVAALIAGALELNDDIRSTADKRTFAFDVFNSSLGFLNACHIAIQLIETEKHQNAMVVTAEIENNTHVYAARLRGLKETGSAIILDRDPEGKTGFGGFLFKQYDTYSEAIITHSEFDGGRTFLNIKVNPDFEAMYLKCIADCVMLLLREQELSIGDIALILPPQISPSFVDKLPETLGANKEKVINVAEAGFDYFGSSLPYSLAYIRMKNLATSGQAGLIINVGSGLQVGCAIYYF